MYISSISLPPCIVVNGYLVTCGVTLNTIIPGQQRSVANGYDWSSLLSCGSSHSQGNGLRPMALQWKTDRDSPDNPEDNGINSDNTTSCMVG